MQKFVFILLASCLCICLANNTKEQTDSWKLVTLTQNFDNATDNSILIIDGATGQVDRSIVFVPALSATAASFNPQRMIYHVYLPGTGIVFMNLTSGFATHVLYSAPDDLLGLYYDRHFNSFVSLNMDDDGTWVGLLDMETGKWSKKVQDNQVDAVMSDGFVYDDQQHIFYLLYVDDSAQNWLFGFFLLTGNVSRVKVSDSWSCGQVDYTTSPPSLLVVTDTSNSLVRVDVATGSFDVIGKVSGITQSYTAYWNSNTQIFYFQVVYPALSWIGIDIKSGQEVSKHSTSDNWVFTYPLSQ